MGNKAEYRSALRSRRLIRDAFLALMQENGSAKMTVTEIVRRADINRATFYAHYSDVQAVISEIE
ncbi:MAG: TetR family transcriptional regulator, partial [Clostridia bacterium]|nr:TetR family transcriptional regulator [Clostridia bacterium]